MIFSSFRESTIHIALPNQRNLDRDPTKQIVSSNNFVQQQQPQQSKAKSALTQGCIKGQRLSRAKSSLVWKRPRWRESKKRICQSERRHERACLPPQYDTKRHIRAGWEANIDIRTGCKIVSILIFWSRVLVGYTVWVLNVTLTLTLFRVLCCSSKLTWRMAS